MGWIDRGYRASPLCGFAAASYKLQAASRKPQAKSRKPKAKSQKPKAKSETGMNHRVL
ncbi:MAG: hypothetical protein ABGX82_06485 [Pseudomonas sp.]|uniref:hypothetical protein n=1 Tax=Pseudomonas sp. TaxID=306 RepID=UPI003241F491